MLTKPADWHHSDPLLCLAHLGQKRFLARFAFAIARKEPHSGAPEPISGRVRMV